MEEANADFIQTIQGDLYKLHNNTMNNFCTQTELIQLSRAVSKDPQQTHIALGSQQILIVIPSLLCVEILKSS